MPVEIIDCHAPELCFYSGDGPRFRCFYVTHRFRGQGFRLFVSEQPDRTAQIIKLNPPPESTPPDDSQRAEEAWGELLQAAWAHLKTGLITVAYVLEERSTGSWSRALAGFAFERQGIVKSLESEPAIPMLDSLAATTELRISTLSAASFQRDHENRSDVVSLLRNTIQFSDDCLLKSRLAPEDVLALFALNPGELKVTLAKSGSFVVGILVGDESHGPNRGHIEYLGVHSDYRRHSIASKLITNFHYQIAPSLMTVAVHEQNLASIAFFDRHNFAEVASYRLWTKD